MDEHRQGVVDDDVTGADSPMNMPKEEQGEAKTHPPTIIDTTYTQMAMSSEKPQVSLLPRKRLIQKTRNVFLSKNLEVIQWKKKCMLHNGSVSLHQKHTFIVVGKAKIARQAARIEYLEDRLNEREKAAKKCEEDAHRFEEILAKIVDEAADKEIKLALVLQEAADAEAKLAQRESDHQDAMSKLEQHNKELAAQITNVVSQLDRDEAAKPHGQPFANSSKVSDASIVAAWARMKYTIEHLASNILTASPTQEDFEHGIGIVDGSCVLNSIDPNQFEQLQNEDMRSFVVEHYIWKAVIGRVFEPGPDGNFGKSWAGTVGMNFTTCFHEFLDLCTRKGMNPDNLIHWKGETGQMIGLMIGVDETELRKVVRMERAAFSKFIPKVGSDYPAKCKKLGKGLSKIFDNALQLQATFMASKAHFYLDRPREQVMGDGCIHFDSGSMTAEGWEKEPLGDGSTVLLNISPALVKVGTADGHHYDSRLLLAKARVICD
ncbi:hypothetical protein CORC01_12319 [Colletotrichum orchidophilum]|uniref:Uncharacterized protein n=1 Tax=Colletotrichum orchidophilum TaxID=1209926 RepID=A0A1G4ATL4_9PEZI|nr:uncharacterized protein CORC01_12319 [Colletotrichum orchidophilum]OHE92392.1 hypothetical protein CORC01_12319 [Colletotrichum orchidophilum]